MAKPKRALVIAALVVVFMVCQHYEILALGGYPVTLGLLAGVTLAGMLNFRPRWLPAILLLSAVVALSAMDALLDPDTVLVQYLRTLSLIALTLLIFASVRRAPTWATRYVGYGFLVSLTLIVTMSVTQVVTGATGSVAWFNPWGAHQYLYEYDPYLQFNPIPRAAGFYLEPSYDAFVIGCLGVWALYGTKRPLLWFSVSLIGEIATRSATGLILFAIIFVIRIARSRLRVALLLAASFIVLAQLVGPYLTSRVSSITTGASSANYRLIAPLNVLASVLTQFPSGRALGSIGTVLATFDLQNGSSQGTTLDNGFYVLVYYFGWFGLALIAFGVLLAANRLRIAPREADVIVWLVGSLAFSGGIFLPEYAISLALLITSVGACLERTASDSHAVGGSGDVQRSRGFTPHDRLARAAAQARW